MDHVLKLAVAAVAVVAVVVVGSSFLPRDGSGTGGQGGAPPSSTAAPSPSPSPEPSPSPSPAADSMGIASSTLRLTIELPEGWENNDIVANSGTSDTAAATAFFLSLVDNTFENPCQQVERTPKVGPTVEDLATALGEIPGLTASAPVQTTIAGYEATYVELTTAATLPCRPDQFYLWTESPGLSGWWLVEADEQLRVWIIELNGERVAIAGRSWPATSDAAKAELVDILDTIVFDGTS